jgi:hypothetical protein
VPFNELQPIISDDSFMSSALDLAADGHFVRPQLRLM